MPELVPTELSPSTPSKSFRNAVKDAVKKFPDPEQSSRAIEFFLKKLMVNTQIKFGLFAGLLDLQPPSKLDISPYLDNPMETRRIGEHFDESRRGINEIVSGLFDYPPNQTQAEKEKMMMFGRSIYSFILTKLLRKSLSESDPEFKQSLRGITWSVMAKDIDKTMGPKGQKPLSSQWREQMRSVIFSKTPDMKLFRAELKKFELGNEEVFFKQTVIPPLSPAR